MLRDPGMGFQADVSPPGPDQSGSTLLMLDHPIGHASLKDSCQFVLHLIG
jgi:hypothetical protein